MIETADYELQNRVFFATFGITKHQLSMANVGRRRLLLRIVGSRTHNTHTTRPPHHATEGQHHQGLYPTTFGFKGGFQAQTIAQTIAAVTHAPTLPVAVHVVSVAVKIDIKNEPIYG